jgi:hypothetical protein
MEYDVLTYLVNKIQMFLTSERSSHQVNLSELVYPT